MPRLYHRPPKYCRHKSTNQAVVYYQGKRIHLGPYGSVKSQDAYQRFLKHWGNERNQKSYDLRASAVAGKGSAAKAKVTESELRTKFKSGLPITITELAIVYHSYTQGYYRKRGKLTREAELIHEVLCLLWKHHASTLVSDFGPVALDELRNRMIKDLDWCRNHINKQVTRLRAMFKWAAAREFADPSVFVALQSLAGLKKGRSKARETKPITSVDDAVIDATLKHLPDVVADMVRFQRLTSARPGEVCNLKPFEVDTSGEVWIYTPSEHKTEHHNKDRRIAIGPKAQAILEPYLERHSERYCFSPKESEERRRAKLRAKRKTPLSSGNRPGTNKKVMRRRPFSEQYSANSYRRAIHKACAKHNIEKWSPNQLRHTASTAIRKKYGLDAARAVDGHSSTATTEIYAELDISKAVQVMREIG